MKNWKILALVLILVGFFAFFLKNNSCGCSEKEVSAPMVKGSNHDCCKTDAVTPAAE